MTFCKSEAFASDLRKSLEVINSRVVVYLTNASSLFLYNINNQTKRAKGSLSNKVLLWVLETPSPTCWCKSVLLFFLFRIMTLRFWISLEIEGYRNVLLRCYTITRSFTEILNRYIALDGTLRALDGLCSRILTQFHHDTRSNSNSSGVFQDF